MDNLLQGCCTFFSFLLSSTKGIFLKNTKVHYIDKLMIPSSLYGFFGQPVTRNHSEQHEESKSAWAGRIRPTFHPCCTEGILTSVTEVIMKWQCFVF